MMSFSSIRTSLFDQLVAAAMVLCHPQEHSQVLRALGIYEEISFDPKTYMELVGPKMGLLSRFSEPDRTGRSNRENRELG